MKKLCLLLFLTSVSSYANTLSTHNNVSKPHNRVVVGVDAMATKRVCYYRDEAYSIGAILQVGEHYMVCRAENDYETNGALRWYSLAETANSKEQSPSYKVE